MLPTAHGDQVFPDKMYAMTLRWIAVSLSGMNRVKIIAAGRRIFHLPSPLWVTLFRADSTHHSDRRLVKLLIGVLTQTRVPAKEGRCDLS